MRGNSVEENLQLWDSAYKWPQHGDEWSSDWGSPKAQWLTSILPRTTAFLPTNTILEIAPGHGRWTEFLRDQCKRLLLVDLSPACIEFCRTRFAECSHIEYHVNDGVSLSFIEDASVDFVFSFDSLVHADSEVMREYVRQLSRKLRPGGAAFIHHSNAGQYRAILRSSRWLAHRLKKVPVAMLHDHWRSLTMTAKQMRAFCEEAGLVVVTQELVPFEKTAFPIDCFTTFRRPAEGIVFPPLRVISNFGLREEARSAKRLWASRGQTSR